MNRVRVVIPHEIFMISTASGDTVAVTIDADGRRVAWLRVEDALLYLERPDSKFDRVERAKHHARRSAEAAT